MSSADLVSRGLGVDRDVGVDWGVGVGRGLRVDRGLELRVSRASREEYGFDEALFATNGDLIVADADAVARLARAMVPDETASRARTAADVAAIGLIHELCHRVIAVERRADPQGGPMARALSAVRHRVGEGPTRASLEAFESAFPASPVYRGEVSSRDWLARPPLPGDVGALEEALEETALLWLANQNRAAGPYRALIGDDVLRGTGYLRLIASLRGDDLPSDEPHPDRAAPARRLIARLAEPLRAEPTSLAGQLRWIRRHWVDWLDPTDLVRIDREVEAVEEQERLGFLRFRARPAPGGVDSAALHGFAGQLYELEAFSPDSDWMTDLVLLAKSTYVWLEQLSRRYLRHIWRLDQVPDEELDEIRSRGFTGLWLIGVWQRSQASERIKRMRGDAEAVASAYSIADYRIADDLGGDEAWRDLRDRAMARGIRLASDMVPNHMGIDSGWVVEHPDRFISTDQSPYPSYSFTGADLSSDPRVVIQIEDHYWDSSDAAVVFRRIDRATGETRFIYHGNDGTSFPWNDTAQLDFLEPDVREAVIGQILDVARRFRIIRFDAAMVLARRHIQRLWYPLPGHEAGIPSRGAHALTASEFQRRMPSEFWRDVVDRVAAEVPDTLLLAEAFWLLEGYFVRTLGMHRVYNSAFMHMLRDERNAEYHAVMRETIAFDPRILGRYVNFMSNPDERTAIDQFGSHDKYSGVATLLATLPGLPMFGHGQVEGFTEKYGMEFRMPRLDERPDEGLVARHRHDIFPLLRQRWRFAGVEHFRLLRCVDGSGNEVPDVFAYSNRGPDGSAATRSLVVYLNRYQRAQVRVLGVVEALGLDDGVDGFVILRDARSELDYVRSTRTLAEGGLELSLDGYRCHVFLAFEEVTDDPDGSWARLAWRLGLDGVSDARGAMERMRDEPIRDAVAGIVALLDWPALTAPDRPAVQAALAALAAAARGEAETVSVAEMLARRLSAVATSTAPEHLRGAFVGWAVGDAVTRVGGRTEPPAAVGAFDAWAVGERLGERLRGGGLPDPDAWRTVELARALVELPPGRLADAAASEGLPLDWFDEAAVRAASGWNEWQGRRYIRREAWSELLEALAFRDALAATDVVTGEGIARATRETAEAAAQLRARALAAGFRLTEPGPGDGGAQPSDPASRLRA
jgi:glycosidase